MTFSITKSDDPKGYRLEAQQLVAEPRGQLFEFFSDAFQLERLTPPWLHFSVATPKPITITAGTLIDYKLRVHGLPMRWRSKISVWEPPAQFVDEQVKGPYRSWHHRHVFEEVEGGTLVRDIVHYRVPFAFLTDVLVKRDLDQIFRYRREAMSRIFTVPDAEPSSSDRTLTSLRRIND